MLDLLEINHPVIWVAIKICEGVLVLAGMLSPYFFQYVMETCWLN